MCSTLPWNEQSNGCVRNLHRVMHLACLDSRRDFSFNNPSLFPVFILNWWPSCWLLRSRRDHIPTKSVEVIPPCEKKKKRHWQNCHKMCLKGVKSLACAFVIPWAIPSRGDTEGAENSTLEDADAEWKMKNRVQVYFLSMWGCSCSSWVPMRNQASQKHAEEWIIVGREVMNRLPLVSFELQFSSTNSGNPFFSFLVSEPF